MKHSLIVLVVGLLVTSVSHAEAVIKCTTETGVSYQTLPCPDGSSAMLGVASQPESQTNADSMSAIPGTLKAKPSGQRFRSTQGELQLGTSDMQVLNNRSWGKPQRISRNREPRAWHEYWNYETGANSGKQLHFVNSKLAGIKDLEPPADVIDTTPVVVVER